jgi:hypothetical protein
MADDPSVPTEDEPPQMQKTFVMVGLWGPVGKAFLEAITARAEAEDAAEAAAEGRSNAAPSEADCAPIAPDAPPAHARSQSEDEDSGRESAEFAPSA